MSNFSIKKIYKVNPKSKIFLRDDPPPDEGTTSESIPTETDYPTFIINWIVEDLANYKTPGLPNSREICAFRPPWPNVAYSNIYGMALFSYICWDGYNATPKDDPSQCSCFNGPPNQITGLCPTNQEPPINDENGGAQTSAFYPTANIQINVSGNYIVELILDGYKPACDPAYLPKLYINSFHNLTSATRQNPDKTVPPGTPPPPDKQLGDNFTRVWTKTPLAVTYSNTTYNLWWPVKQYSTIAPIPSPPPESVTPGSTPDLDLSGLFFLTEGEVLQFVIVNSCGGSGTQSIGSFNGTIRITPQFPF